MKTRGKAIFCILVMLISIFQSLMISGSAVQESISIFDDTLNGTLTDSSAMDSLTATPAYSGQYAMSLYCPAGWSVKTITFGSTMDLSACQAQAKLSFWMKGSVALPKVSTVKLIDTNNKELIMYTGNWTTEWTNYIFKLINQTVPADFNWQITKVQFCGMPTADITLSIDDMKVITYDSNDATFTADAVLYSESTECGTISGYNTTTASNETAEKHDGYHSLKINYPAAWSQTSVTKSIGISNYKSTGYVSMWIKGSAAGTVFFDMNSGLNSHTINFTTNWTRVIIPLSEFSDVSTITNVRFVYTSTGVDNGVKNKTIYVDELGIFYTGVSDAFATPTPIPVSSPTPLPTLLPTTSPTSLPTFSPNPSPTTVVPSPTADVVFYGDGILGGSQSGIGVDETSVKYSGTKSLKLPFGNIWGQSNITKTVALDMSSYVNTGYVSMWVKGSEKGYLNFNLNGITALQKSINFTTEWSRIIIPLGDFVDSAGSMNFSAIRQCCFTYVSAGVANKTVYVDELGIFYTNCPISTTLFVDNLVCSNLYAGRCTIDVKVEGKYESPFLLTVARYETDELISAMVQSETLTGSKTYSFDLGTLTTVDNTTIKIFLFDEDSIIPYRVPKIYVLPSTADINTEFYPGWTRKALTFSFDDGAEVYDNRLINIFRANNIKSTFNLIGDKVNGDGGYYVPAIRVPAMYNGFEVGNHSQTHFNMTATNNTMTVAQCKNDILNGKTTLETLLGVSILGFAWPNGDPKSSELYTYLESIGVKYARTADSSTSFALPYDWLKWTQMYSGKLPTYGPQFLAAKDDGTLKLMAVWGHSWEYENNNNWNTIENFAPTVKDRTDIWKCTNLEVCNYIKAKESMVITSTEIQNPTDIDLYVKVNNAPVVIPAHTNFPL